MPRRKAKRRRSTLEIVGLAAIGVFVVGIIWLAFFAQPQTTNQTPTYRLAPDFTLTDVDGKTFRLSDQRGKVVVLEFMNSECPGCIAEAPNTRQLRSTFGNDVIMASISIPLAAHGPDTVETLRTFRNQNQAGWIAMLDSGQTAETYSVQATPTLFIIDQNGYIRYQHEGVTEAPVLINEVESLTK